MAPHYKKMEKQKIDLLCQQLAVRVVDILDYFGVDYSPKDNYLHGCCPVHGGDNPTAFTVYIDGDDMMGNWYCWTHHCERECQPTMLGLIRGLLESRKDDKVSFMEAVNFSKRFVKDLDENPDALSSEKARFINSVRGFNKKAPQPVFNIGREDIRKRLTIPATYYIKRGYSPETLDRFDVGLCSDKTKAMNGRVVVPVYDDNYQKMVGCVGRATADNNNAKWVNSKGFHAGHYLYNYWFAQEHIQSTGVAVLVEGQGDVWRLYEAGILNCVGLFGCSITDAQLVKLESSGAMSLVVLMDNDEAGKKAIEQITNKCERLFNIYFPEMEEHNKDVGEMSVEDVSKIIQPFVEKASQ